MESSEWLSGSQMRQSRGDELNLSERRWNEHRIIFVRLWQVCVVSFKEEEKKLE